MLSWLKNHWSSLLGGAVVGAVAVRWADMRRSGAFAQLPGAAQVGLQPGETTVAIVKGGSLTATLPAGASWSTAQKAVSPLNPTSAQPTGAMAFVISPINASMDFSFKWNDSSGNPKSTTVHVAVQ